MTKPILQAEVEKILPLIGRYPKSIQVGLVKYYLLFLLKNDSQESVIDQCKDLQSSLTQFNGESASDKSDSENLDSIAFHLGVDFTGRELDSEKINHIMQMLDALKGNLTIISLKKSRDLVSVSELLSNIVDDNTRSTLTMNESVEGMFDRILSSLDPSTAEHFLDQSIEREGDEKKAAMYDAICEKYEQLFEYHKSGRLVKDFRRLYREKSTAKK